MSVLGKLNVLSSSNSVKAKQFLLKLYWGKTITIEKKYYTLAYFILSLQINIKLKYQISNQKLNILLVC